MTRKIVNRSTFLPSHKQDGLVGNIFLFIKKYLRYEVNKTEYECEQCGKGFLSADHPSLSQSGPESAVSQLRRRSAESVALTGLLIIAGSRGELL